MGAFDISYNDIAGDPLGYGKKKVAPIQAAQGIAAPTAALSSPQLIDARQSITQAPTVQQLVPAQSITQGAESYMRAHQPGDAAAISYPPIMPDATTSPRPVPVMPTPPGIAKSMSGGAGQQPAPATIADIRRPTMQAQPMRTEQAVPTEAVPTGPMISQEVKDGLANGAAQAFSSTLGAIQKSGDAAQRAAGEGNYGGAIGHVIRGAAGGIAGIGDDVMRSAAKVLDPAANALKTLVTGDSTPINQAASQSAAVKTIADVVQPGGQQSYRPGSATANALNETDAYPQSRPGDPLAKDSTPQKPGRNAEGVITAGSAKDAMGEDMQRSGGVFGTMDMKGVNDIMARENQARGEMIDSMIKANGGNGIAVMPDSQGRADAEWNAKVDSRGAISDLQSSLRRAGTRTERAAIGQALNTMLAGQNQLATESLRGENQQIAEQGRNAVAMRGQDMTALSDANRLAGNPVDNELKRAQAGGIAAQTESAKMLADIQRKALAGDQQAAATYRALTGKSGADYKDRYITLPNRKVYNEVGQIVGEESGGIFDAATGLPVQADGGQGTKPGATGADKIKSDMQAGKISRKEAIKQLKAMGYQ